MLSHEDEIMGRDEVVFLPVIMFFYVMLFKLESISGAHDMVLLCIRGISWVDEFPEVIHSWLMRVINPML